MAMCPTILLYNPPTSTFDLQFCGSFFVEKNSLFYAKADGAFICRKIVIICLSEANGRQKSAFAEPKFDFGR